MSAREYWEEGARQAYEEMSCLMSAGATPDELTQITGRLMAAHGDNAGTAEDQARTAGYLQMTADITEQQLYRRDAELEADREAGELLWPSSLPSPQGPTRPTQAGPWQAVPKLK